MKSNVSPKASLAATALSAAAASAAEPPAIPQLIEKIKSPDDKVRGPAWQSAGPCGAAAVAPLAEVMANPDFEVARAAKRALWLVVRYAGRPGAAEEKTAVTNSLLPLLAQSPDPVRREVLWMLSEIGDEQAIAPIAPLLSNKELREDARMSLERIPHPRAVETLKEALAKAPEDFRPNLAHSLRVRGVAVEGYPSQKLVPTRPRTVSS